MAVSIGNSRVGNASRVAVGTEDTNYTLPSNSVEYVYAASIQISGGDRIDSGQNVTLQFRTGADSFATLSNASGAVRTGTVLTDQNAVTSGERLTTTGGSYTEGVEIEGTNSVGTQLNRTQSGACECQWSLDFSNAPSGTTYDFQVAWVHKNGTDTFQYLSITTYTPVPPVLSSATVTNRRNTTATVGCTTDTPAEGTLYYYVSTSATPPTAANLKNGTDAVAFGNTTNPAAPQTFAVTGLTKGTTYYTHFIHNNTIGDSNILTSASWITTNFTQKVWRARAINEALTGTTWLAAENTAVGVDVTSGDVTLRVRLGRENTTTPDTGTTESMAAPQYRVNSGAWTDINLVTASRACSLTTTTAYDASATGYTSDSTKRLTGHTGSITFGWAAEWTDLAIVHPNSTLSLAGVEEFEYAIVFNAANLTDSDVVEIRINSTLVTDYTAYATFNITKGSAPVTGTTIFSLNTSENIINNLNTNESSSFSSNLTEAVANTLSTLSTATLDLDAGKIYQNSISSIQFSDLSVTLDKLIDEIVMFNSSALLGVNSSLQSSNNLNTNGSSSLSQNLEQTIFNILTGRTNADLNLNLGENLLNTATINSTIQYAIDIASICSSVTSKEVAINFVSNFTKAALNVNNALAELLVDLVIASNYESIKTSLANTTFAMTLSKSSEAAYGSIVVEGSTVLGTIFAKTAINNTIYPVNANISTVLSTTEEVNALLNKAVTFSIALTADYDYLSYAVFDDAIWSLTSGEYIFTDLTNIVVDNNTIKAVYLTITNNLGQTQSVGLIGQAAAEILVTLGKLQSSSALYNENTIFNSNLAKTSSTFATFLRNLTFALDIGKLSTADTAKLVNLILALTLAENQVSTKITSESATISLDLSKLSTNNRSTFVNALYGIIEGQTEAVTKVTSDNASLDIDLTKLSNNTATLVKNILYDVSLVKVSDVTKNTNDTLVLDILLSESSAFNFLANANIDFNITKDFLSTTSADLNVAINYLQNLDTLAYATFYSLKFGDTSFNMNLIKSSEVKGILTSTLNIIGLLGDTELATGILNDSISYLIQLQQQTESNILGLATIELILSAATVQDGNTGIIGALDFILNLTKQSNITVDYYEVLSLILGLVQTSSIAATKSGIINLGVTLSQSQLNTLTAILTAVFVQNLSTTQNVQADLNTTIAIATLIATQLLGERIGNPEAFITFGTSISQNNVSIRQTFDAIDLALLLQDAALAGKQIQVPVDFSIVLEDSSVRNLIKEGIVQFSTHFIKAGENKLLSRPSISMNLEMAELSINSKKTLTNLILGLQQSATQIGSSTLPVFITYALLNDLDLTLGLIADGRLTLSTELQKTGVTQLLAQANLTFGHIIALASLSGALRDAGIEIGTITGLSATGFRIEFELVTPDGRKFKVYLEDRITIVDEENRVIKIFGKPRDNTIN